MVSRLLTAAEVGELLQLGRSTIYDLCSRGEMPHVVVSEGRRRPTIRFEPAAVERFIAERTRAA